MPPTGIEVESDRTSSGRRPPVTITIDDESKPLLIDVDEAARQSRGFALYFEGGERQGYRFGGAWAATG
ncbi:MAG: hypothetical protein JSS68_10560 [Actinobacteria bacterium]|nr:hypothetical protein [Actinomycetota bacterium]